MDNNQLFSNFYNREDIIIRIQQYELEVQRLKGILAEIDKRNANVAQVKITREMVMQLLMNNPNDFFQTVTIVDNYFPGLSDEERGRQVKIVSVYLSGLMGSGLVAAKKLPGVKGNLYKWK